MKKNLKKSEKSWSEITHGSLFPAPTPKTRRISFLLEQETRIRKLNNWEKKVLTDLINHQNKFGQLSIKQWDLFQDKLLKRKLI